MGEGGKSERLQCWNHVIAMAVESGLGGLRLSEYTADEREKERNEKERNKEAERGEVQIRPDERQPRMTLLRRAEIQRQECRPSRMEKEG